MSIVKAEDCLHVDFFFYHGLNYLDFVAVIFLTFENEGCKEASWNCRSEEK